MESSTCKPAPFWPQQLCRWPAAIVLLTIHAALAIGSLRGKSATFDEVVRLTAGYAYWVTGDYRLDPAEPPLAQMWASLPLLLEDYRFPDLNQPAWWIGDAESIGRQFFFGLDNDTSAMLSQARTMIVLLSVALGLLVYLWSRWLFGPGGAVLSLVLYAFSPNMLAHGRLVTTETAACLFFVAALGGIWWVLCEVKPASALASSVGLAGLFLSKMSAPLIIVAGALMLVVRVVSRRPLPVRLGRTFLIRHRIARLGVWMGVIVLQICVVAAGIWGAHRSRYAGMVDTVPGRDRYCPPVPLPPDASSWDYVLNEAGAVGRVVGWFRQHRLLPESYLYGVAFQFRALGAGYGFLNGERRISGWRTFFPYCLAVKTPLGLFGLLILAGVAAVWWRQSTQENRGTSDPAAVMGVVAIVIFLAAYWVAAVRSQVNIGHRHILPTYPFMFILAGGAATWWRTRVRFTRWATAGCAAAFAGASVWIWPDYLAYFNLTIGGPKKAYQHLVDSSLDWGQDLPGLKRWLDEQASAGDDHSASPPVYLSYFGTDTPERFGIEATMLPSHMPWRRPSLETLRSGTYCISATMLQLMYIMPTNDWTETFETAYLVLRPEYGNGLPDKHVPEEAEAFRLLRFARLCAALRRRLPDDQVNHTMLVYRLSDGYLAGVLDGPPAKVVPDRPIAAGPEQITWMARLARMLARRGQVDRAVSVYRGAAAHSPNDVDVLNGLAWLLATCRDDDIRDGPEALRLATRASRFAVGERWDVLATLGAACAEVGQFTWAAQCAHRAEALARQAGFIAQAEQIAKRAASYRDRTAPPR